MFPRLTKMKQSFDITLDNYQSEFKTEEALLLDFIIYIYIYCKGGHARSI